MPKVVTVTLQAPADRPLGPRILKVTEPQAKILRQCGWTDIVQNTEIVPEVIENRAIFPNEMPRQKRKYTRRIKAEFDEEGNPVTVTKPKRRYRRRDMQAEDET